MLFKKPELLQNPKTAAEESGCMKHGGTENLTKSSLRLPF